VRVEDELPCALRESVSDVASSEDAWRSIDDRLSKTATASRGSRIGAIALALTLSAATCAGIWWALRAVPHDRAGDARPQPTILDPHVADVVPVGPEPADVAVGEGAVWVSVPAQASGQESSVVRINPVTSEVVSRIPVDGYIEEIAAGAGGVWVWGAQFDGPGLSPYVVRIDPASNEVVARITDVSSPLAVGDGSLWAVDRAGARAGPQGSLLLRIDPTANQVVARIPLGVAAWDIEFGDGFVWVLSMEPNPGDGDVVQVDPATNAVVARIEIPLQETGYPPTVYAPAVGGGLAWVPVCCPDNELILVRIDAAAGVVVGEPITLRGGAPFAVTAEHVWVIQEGGALYGLNVSTLDVDEGVSGFDWPAGGFPDPTTELDPETLAVWVVNADQDSVTRIDLAAPVPPSDRQVDLRRLGAFS
jgi:DNA-binding beta-propeller fold protein YncE